MSNLILPENNIARAVPGFTIGAEGLYRCLIHRGKSGTLKHDTGWFGNLLLDNGLDTMMQGGFLKGNSTCHVGTATTAPVNGETKLGSQIGKTATREQNHTRYTYSSFSTQAPWWHGATAYYYFTPGSAVGNISEIGISASGDDNSLCSRALILNSNSEPTTISVGNFDSLTVVYTGRIYLPMTDVTGTISFGDDEHTYIVRACGAGVNSSSIGAGLFEYGMTGYSSYPRYVYVSDQPIRTITESPHLVSNLSSTNYSMAAYVPGSFTRTCTMNWGQFDINKTWKTIVFPLGRSWYAGATYFQAELSPAFDKTTRKSVSLTWKVSIARYAP